MHIIKVNKSWLRWSDLYPLIATREMVYQSTTNVWWTTDPRHLHYVEHSDQPVDLLREPVVAIPMATWLADLKPAEEYGEHGLDALAAAYHGYLLLHQYPMSGMPTTVRTWKEVNALINQGTACEDPLPTPPKPEPKRYHAYKQPFMVIYHANCSDGFCAAWAAHHVLQTDCRYSAAHHGHRPITAQAASRRTLYLLDFCYPADVLRRLASAAVKITVIDHHKTTIPLAEELRDVPNLTFILDVTKSGGRLAWEHFLPDQEPHWLVKYTEDRDLWRHALPNSNAINAAIRSYKPSFSTWDALSQRDPQSLVAEGETLHRRDQQLVDQHVANAREIVIDGHVILAVNATVLISEIAHQLAVGRPFGACYFDRKDGLRQWSLRSTDQGIDVSVVAKRRGGGGHKHAAGFEIALTNPIYNP